MARTTVTARSAGESGGSATQMAGGVRSFGSHGSIASTVDPLTPLADVDAPSRLVPPQQICASAPSSVKGNAA